MRRTALLASAALVLASVAEAAERAPAHAELRVKRGPGTADCLSQPALERAVEKRLERAVFSGSPDLRLELSQERTSEGFRVEILLSDAGGRELGRRELATEAPHCSALDDSLALVVALLVDSPPEPPEPPAPVAETPPPAPVARAAPDETSSRIVVPEDTHAPREPWRFEVAGGVSAALGRVPGVGFGARLSFGFLPPPAFEFRISVGGLLPAEERVLGGQAGARLSLLDFGVEVCPLAHRTNSLRLVGCVGQSIGRIRASGVGFLDNRRFDRLDLVVTAGVGAWLLVAPPFGVRAVLSAGVPLGRDAYVAETAEGARFEVFRPSPVLGLAEIGAGVEF